MKKILSLSLILAITGCSQVQYNSEAHADNASLKQTKTTTIHRGDEIVVYDGKTVRSYKINEGSSVFIDGFNQQNNMLIQ